MKGKLEGKVAIVTGAGANIGEACAKALANAAASLVVADINLEGAERVAGEIRDAGGLALARHVNLTEESSICALVEATLAHYGCIDILHNNAADTRPAQMAADGSIAELEAAVWDSAFTVNARGTMLMTKHCLPPMIEGGGGSIINTSSGVSILGDIFNPSYSASKAAVNAFTRNTAVQYGRLNIRCNAILPGMILTPSSRAAIPPEQLALLQKQTLLPRLGTPEDIATAVVFLASDEASFVTGQLFGVDGGITTHQAYVGDVLEQLN